MQNVFRQLHLDNLTRTKAPVALVQNANAAELYLYDVISADWGISAGQVIDAIDQAKGSEVLQAGDAVILVTNDGKTRVMKAPAVLPVAQPN